MIASDKCYALIKHYEGCQLKAYKCPAGYWTIGWGNTSYENGQSVQPGQLIQQWRADELLKVVVESKARSVQNLTSNVILKQCQFDALVSFQYNMKPGRLASSTLLKKVLKNPDDPTIKDEFPRWNKAEVKGKLVPLKGLTARRQSEAHLYFNNEVKTFN